MSDVIELDISSRPAEKHDFAVLMATGKGTEPDMRSRFKTVADWRVGNKGHRPYIALAFKLAGVEYQMRLVPNALVFGPSVAVMDREFRRVAALDAERYGNWEPDE